EALHSLLLTDTPLIAPERQRALRDRLWSMLPVSYRGVLAGAGPRDAAPRGALAPTTTDGSREPPESWPGLARPRSLAGEAPVTRLLARALAADWPPRDQGASPSCVAFAACAALEAAGAVAPGERLSAAFLYRRMRLLPLGEGPEPPGAEIGATKLGDAARVIVEEGLLTEREWRDSSPMRLERQPMPDDPGETLRDQARQRRLPFGLGYWDRGDQGWPGAARAVLELLKEGRPVAVTLPEYEAPVGRGAITNWRLPAVWLRGEVLDPPKLWKRAASGHAVCILGFQPAEDDPLGGWFIFRNSLGLRFATGAPGPERRSADGTPLPPRVPDNGYGAISAIHIEDHLWEILAPPVDPLGVVA
ncbi:MAG: hypothetical protein MUC64_17995, partial [Rubritepida sp.]|nr:hypothetical protein [Rubritepida sp.]